MTAELISIHLHINEELRACLKEGIIYTVEDLLQ